MGAVPIHHTATDDGPWDGPAQEKKLSLPLTTKTGNAAYAWVDPKADDTTKVAWKFIHHFVASSGSPGAASTMACSTGIGVLNGGRTGTTIPDADRKGVHAHLAAHLIDAGVKEQDVPELKARRFNDDHDDAGKFAGSGGGSGGGGSGGVADSAQAHLDSAQSHMDAAQKAADAGDYATAKSEQSAAGADHAAVASLLSRSKDDAAPCPTCDGSGKIKGGSTKCPDCNGTGDAPEAKAVVHAAMVNTVRDRRERLYGDEFRAESRNQTEIRCVRQMDPTSRIAQQFEMREVENGTGGTSLRFSGYASVVERGYEVSDMFGPYQETISRNAFNKTIKDGADVNFLTNHGGITMARTKSGTLQLSSDSTGLYTEATLNPSRPDVQIIRAAVEDGDLDEMSFAFRATRQEWNEDYTEREIQEVNMHQGDVSVVNFGANPATGGTVSMRAAAMLEGLTPEEYLSAMSELIEHRAGAQFSAATKKTLQTILDLTHGADENVDHVQVMLSSLMGVKNPDVDQDAAMDKTDPSKNTPPSTTTADGEDDAPASSSRAVIPDYTTEQRQRLAAMRERKSQQ